ncbi:hypothetical protein Agabi119p4_9445 [Agaricus bisporus var. burnettii]|uniref:J domain-containing protein n=1 Tax=Agaricus bisporus var. burnettii TaxID=192524 RepID=A0A8H7EWN7_AGABI|nr:hypothetical protein Agabi119p4_9445 [Agaricus bisporus var. burnettii]
MPTLPESHPHHVASPASNTDPPSRQPSVGSFSTSYPHHPSRTAKPRDSLDIEPIDEGERGIWRNVKKELDRMLANARDDLKKEIKADPEKEASLRKQHEETTVVEFRRMAHEHYLAELAREREERSWLSGQNPSPSLVKQQHGIMNRIQSSTGGNTSSSSPASSSSAASSTVHNVDTHPKPSSSPSADASELRPRSDSRSSLSKPLPSFTQRPYLIPPLPPQLEAAAARRTSHGAGANNRDESFGNAATHDTHGARHSAFDDELQRPSSTSNSSLRSKASFNEFSAAPGSNGANLIRHLPFESLRASSERHYTVLLPGSKPMDEFWTPSVSPEEDAAAAKQHPSINRRGSDASMRSMSSVASSRHPPNETIPARADKLKDREPHERKAKDLFPAPSFVSDNRSPSSVSPAPGVPTSYNKPRYFNDSGGREREYSDSSVPSVSAQYLSRPHQSMSDEWPLFTPPAPPKTSRPSDPGNSYDSFHYPPPGPYQEPAIRPAVMRSGSYSRNYSNHEMHDDQHRPYPSHSQSIPVPHRSPNPATMASSADQSESFTGQSPGWREWKYHQPPIAEDYAEDFKSPSRNSFEGRYSANSMKNIDESSEHSEYTAWRRRNEQRLRDMRAEVSTREADLQRLEEDMKKKERELNNEKAELRKRQEMIAEREERLQMREQKLNTRCAEFEGREMISREEAERRLKVAKSREEDARRMSGETQKLNEEAQKSKDEARELMEEALNLMDEAQKSMEEAKSKESEVMEREEVVKNLEASTKELHALVGQTEKSLEAREKDLKEKDRMLKKKEEEMKKREEDFKKKVTDAKKKDLSLNHRSDDVSNRERAISNRENEVRRKEEDLENRERAIQSRERDAEMSKYDLEDRATSVAERERDAEMRESSLIKDRKEVEAVREDLKKQWNDLQKREHDLLNKMKEKLGDDVPKENEMDKDREKREDEGMHDHERRERERREEERDRIKREEADREEQRIQEQMRRLQMGQEIQEAREEKRRRLEEEERRRASEERKIREEAREELRRCLEEEERRRASDERKVREEARRQEQKRQQGIADGEKAKEEERKRQQELHEAKEKAERDREARFKEEQERIRLQREHHRRDSSGPDGFWSSNSASGSNRGPPTRANSTTSHDSRGASSGPSGWSSSAGSSGWGTSPGTSAWSSAKATSASSSASSNARRKPSTNFGTHSSASASTSGTEKPKSAEEQNKSTREKYRLDQERQETLRQAKLASAGKSSGDMMQVYMYHENQWETLSKHERLEWGNFPWPMFTLPKTVEDITSGAIWAYLKQEIYLAKDKPGPSIKDRIKDQIKKWHPDRFETKLLPKVVESQKDVVKEGAGNVVRCLNDLLERAPSLMGW